MYGKCKEQKSQSNSSDPYGLTACISGKGGSANPLRSAVMTAATGLDHTAHQRIGAGAEFTAGAMTDGARNHVVAQRPFGLIVHQRQRGIGQRAQDHLPIEQELADHGT